MLSNFLKTLFSLSIILVFVALTSMGSRNIKAVELEFKPETPLWEVLILLGDKKPAHYIEKPSDELIEKGRQLVFNGQLVDAKGNKTKRISRFFKCIHCHNTTIEDPDLTVSNPETRLDFVIGQNKPLLPATTFYGIVNRTTYYNDDYAKKYGKLVEPARDSLVNAMQLCATECSQGRKLEEWEVKAILAYYYSIQFTLGDIKLGNDEYEKLKMVFKNDYRNIKGETIKYLKSKYLQASPATFVDYADKSIRKFGEQGNPQIGQKIYVHSCMNCHKTVGGVTNFKLDMEKVTFRTLKRSLNKNNHFSAYYMVRKGTYAVPGYKPYMPNFSKERLSLQQMEDLVAFINQQAQ